tara:strand:- start:299 stop:727 length:429 start_codon:yes stop_codon:yes gene_type:complete
MNSIFDNFNTHIILYLEPFLNPLLKTYHNIISLSSTPDGPLKSFVTKINGKPLSTFQNDIFSPCINVLLRYPITQLEQTNFIQNYNSFMNDDDIPSIFSYLQQNGYTVDTNLTQLLLQHDSAFFNNNKSSKRRMICMITYNP